MKRFGASKDEKNVCMTEEKELRDPSHDVLARFFFLSFQRLDGWCQPVLGASPSSSNFTVVFKVELMYAHQMKEEEEEEK